MIMERPSVPLEAAIYYFNDNGVGLLRMRARGGWPGYSRSSK